MSDSWSDVGAPKIERGSMSESADRAVEFVRAELAVIDFRPGDTVVLMYPEQLSAEKIGRLSEQWNRNFPEIKCVVIDSGARLGVIRATETPVPSEETE